MRNPNLAKKQSGFTLIEIAIVLVIIGLLLGGVLKGQELINSAKVKNFAQDFKQIPLFIYGYQDKFKRLPGDDSAAVTHVGCVGCNGNGDGTINGVYNSITITDESIRFWQHVRSANLAAGSTNWTDITTAALPTNADGGRIGIQQTTPINGMTGSYFICSEGIQGKFAKQLDTTLDDGVTDTGSLRVAIAVSPWTAPLNPVAAPVDGTTYVVCIGF